ncbi:SRR1-like protein [Haliotis rufescens]|uniref:SRR1-like protein n=1 Tax=Haliotis rufescens TaxID=6454 RepID=UPI00201F9920|nr:SRR1-like protein [Haliotis rufescens]
MADSEDFVVVKNSKGRRRRPRRSRDCVSSSTEAFDRNESDNDIDYGRVKAKIHLYRDELKCSEFYINVLDQLKQCYLTLHQDSEKQEAERRRATDLDGAVRGVAGLSLSDPPPDSPLRPDMECVCYGVGNVSSNIIAQYQLALVMALREDLKLKQDKCFMFDPAFTDGDKQTLQDLHFSIIPVNEEGKRRCRVPTLFFLPHCGKALYNNLLWCNWLPHMLRNIVIVGNSFTAMVERTPERLLKQTGLYILKIQEFTVEIPLSPVFHHSDVFNDMAIHYFPLHRLTTAPGELWEAHDAPVYRGQEAEIILSC